MLPCSYKNISGNTKTEEEVHSAFRNWLDRPALDNPKNKPYPIYTNFHKPRPSTESLSLMIRKTTVAILGNTIKKPTMIRAIKIPTKIFPCEVQCFHVVM